MDKAVSDLSIDGRQGTASLRDGTLLAFSLAERDGRLIVDSLTVTAPPGEAAPNGVTAAVLRSVPVGRIFAAVNSVEAEESADNYLVPGAKAKGRKGKPEGFYERVSQAYSFASRQTRAPAARIAEANDVPTATVHGWISEARRRGLLPSGQNGRAG